MPDETTASKDRLHYLDGLRGLLALLVFAFHLIGSNLTLVQTFFLPDAQSRLYDSPFGALLAGWQFVLGFFILSGIALTLPVLKSKGKFNWLAYYPSRLIRLYLPVVASIGLAALIIILFAHPVTGPGTGWLQAQVLQHVSNLDLANAFALREKMNKPFLNAPLWSLRWEILFSLLLPLLFVALRQVNKKLSFGWLLVCITGIIMLATYTKAAPLLYMAMFPIGMLWAFHLDEIRAVATTVAKYMGIRLFVYGTLALIVVLFWFSAYRFMGFFGPSYDTMFIFQVVAALIGTLLLIFIASTKGPLQTFLTGRGMRFAGKISFSLYLTHLPIIVLLAYIIPPSLWYLNFLLAIPTVLITAWLFWFLIERPIHLGSQRLRRGIAQRTDAAWQAFTAKSIATLNAPIGNKQGLPPR